MAGDLIAALLRRLIAAGSIQALRAALAAEQAAARNAAAAARCRALLDLADRHACGLGKAAAILALVRHDAAYADEAEGLAAAQALFDAAAARSPETAVALLSLGDPDRLAQATAAVVAVLDRWALIGPGTRVLDIGCGIGRFAAALAPRVASVVGLDLSPRMVDEARARCAGLANVRLRHTDGRSLAGIADASIDLALAIDSFPYIVQAGRALARRHVEEAARVLAPGGSLVIFNYAYGTESGADRAELKAFGAACGLTLVDAGQPVDGWDAAAFRLRLDGAAAGIY